MNRNKNKSEFFAFMQVHDRDDMPDGAWFQMLCDAGEEWLKQHPERGKDGNDMAHSYLSMCEEANRG